MQLISIKNHLNDINQNLENKRLVIFKKLKNSRLSLSDLSATFFIGRSQDKNEKCGGFTYCLFPLLYLADQ